MKNILFVFIAMILICACNDKKAKKEGSSEQTGSSDFGELYQYYHANPTTLEQKDENSIIEYAADKNLNPIRTTSGIYIHTIVEGKGDSIKWGDKLTVDYKGYFLDGKEFDSSYSRGTPIKFRVGQMMRGWNEALPFLRQGSKATLLIPSHMAYGKKGFPGYVGPDMNLAFDLEILEENQ